MRVLASDADRVNPTSLGAMPLLSDSGSVIRLDQVATLTQDSGPAADPAERSSARYFDLRERRRSPDRRSRPATSGPATACSADPEGYRVTFGGQVQQQETAFATLARHTRALGRPGLHVDGRAIRVLLTPLAILFSIPVALVGAIVAPVCLTEHLQHFLADRLHHAHGSGRQERDSAGRLHQHPASSAA